MPRSQILLISHFETAQTCFDCKQRDIRNRATVTITHKDPVDDAVLCETCFEARRREDILVRFGAADFWKPPSTF